VDLWGKHRSIEERDTGQRKQDFFSTVQVTVKKTAACSGQNDKIEFIGLLELRKQCQKLIYVAINALLAGLGQRIFDFLGNFVLVLELFDHVLIDFLVVVRQVLHRELLADLLQTQTRGSTVFGFSFSIITPNRVELELEDIGDKAMRPFLER